ncbi:MAG: flavodoxin/nitric oxide synthase, partial [Proteobacteria bacterium]|nr:flavodoxin/nitric oxide synthase [Pseudomonadota bacterium]
MAHITIIVGTESGNAQMCADYLQDQLPQCGHRVDVVGDADVADLDLAGRDVVLICTSTHGDGELPDNLAPFARRLQDTRP